MADLTERLVEAAAAAIRSRETAITSGSANLRSIHVELELANGGDIVDSTCWTERRGVHRKKGG